MFLKVIQKTIPEALREAVSETTTDKKKNWLILSKDL
jgi:hypothetical protein